MIVIHIDSQSDTAFLKKTYEGIKHTIVLYNPTKKNVNETLRQYPNEDVMMLGHGSTLGLFSHDWKGYVIDNTNVNLLKGRNCVGIWCWAKKFAKNHGLKGYFTSMFISNKGEAEGYGYHGHTEKEIFDEVEVFSIRIHDLIENETPYYEWVDSLKRVADMSKDFVKYNYDAMEYLDGTQEAQEGIFIDTLFVDDGKDVSMDYEDVMDDDVNQFFEDYCFEHDIEGEWAREIVYPIFVAGWNARKFNSEGK